MPHTTQTDARWRTLRIAARLAYVAVVLAATWTGLAPEFDPYLARLRLQRALAPGFRPMDVLDGIRNVALFAGLGCVWAVTGDPTRLRRSVVSATVVGFALSVLAETAQLFSPRRMASVLDLATNGGGALLGALLLAVAIRLVARRRARAGGTSVPHLLVAGPYLAACLLEAFSAWYRDDRVPNAHGGFRTRWAATMADFPHHAFAAPTWSDVLLFTPAGFLAARVLLARGLRPLPAAALATAAGALTWAVAELLRGVSGADMRLWAVALHAAATLTGAALAAAGATRARVPAALGRLHADPRVYVLLLALWSLRPFAPVTSGAELLGKLSRDAFVPMRALAQFWSLHSVADVAIGFCLYLPVGAWLAVHPRPDGRRRAIWPGLLLAAVTEVAQVGVRGRTFDVTDVLVQVGGVLVGWMIVLRADARRSRMATPAAPQSALGNVSGGSSLGASAARSSGSTARVASKW